MSKHLPTYGDREPDAFRLGFKGAADNLDDAFDLDEQVTLIVRGKVKDPTFKTNQFGVLRLVQSVDVDFAEVADEETAKRLTAEIKRRQDEDTGQESLDEEIDGHDDEGEGEDG